MFSVLSPLSAETILSTTPLILGGVGAVFEGRICFRLFMTLRCEEALHIIQGLAQAWAGVNGSYGLASQH